MRLPSYQELSKEQDAILDLPLEGRHLVAGPPGTGKTVLALLRGNMLKKINKPFRLLMFNHALHKYTSQSAKSLNLNATVEVYHKFFYRFIATTFRQALVEGGFVDARGRVFVPEVENYLPDFDLLFSRIITPENANTVAIPDLIVDEGQDLPGGFYLLFSRMAANTTVFADENQMISRNGSTITSIRTFGGFNAVYRITRNYRNSREIAQLAAGFFTGLNTGIPTIPERRGDLPRLIRTRTLEDLLSRIVIAERNAPDRSIGVLVQTLACIEKIKNGLERLGTQNPVQSHKDDGVDFDSPGIKLVTHASSKGLEFDTVFLPELQDVRYNRNAKDEIKRMLFVLTSRAREHLILAYRGDTLPLLEVFPGNWKELVEEQEAPGSMTLPPTQEIKREVPRVPRPVEAQHAVGSHHMLRASEIIPALDASAAKPQNSRQMETAGVIARFHSEIHLFIQEVVETARTNPGRIIGVYTQQTGLYKRLVNRLTGKVPALVFHESISDSLTREELDPGVHVVLGCDLEGSPFDILMIPRAEQFAVDTPQCRRQLAELLMAATMRVILSYETRPTPLLPGLDAIRLRKLQDQP